MRGHSSFILETGNIPAFWCRVGSGGNWGGAKFACTVWGHQVGLYGMSRQRRNIGDEGK